jgi:hypothetical protein
MTLQDVLVSQYGERRISDRPLEYLMSRLKQKFHQLSQIEMRP